MAKQDMKSMQQELTKLPKGSIVRRVIRGAERFYHQWREDGKTRSKYLKPDEVEPLRAKIERRKELERQIVAGGQPILPSGSSARFLTNVATGANLERFARGVESFHKRDMFPSIMKYLRSSIADRVLVVCGLRRTGKTTMLRQAILELSQDERAKTAYMKMTERDTMANLKTDLETLHGNGFEFVFIDEVTLLEDFIDTASLLSDLFAGMGMKVVLSGTDSLGFWFAERDELYDRAFSLHTTFIPFREHSRLLGTIDVDDYIRYGGTLRVGEILFDHGDAKNDAASFRDDETTRFYIDTAIARNIQRSLRCVDGGSHFRLLIGLYEAGELTNAINRIIEDMNHRFVLQVLTREFESSDLKLAAKNLLKSKNRKIESNALSRIDVASVTKRLMDILDIRRAEELKSGITDGCAEQIREYLQALDLIVPCPVKFAGVTREASERVLFSQPGMRFCQAQALVHSLMNDISFSSASANDRAIVRNAILDEVKGRMLGDIILLETIKANTSANISVFKLQFAEGEYDMVVANTEEATCELYEVKHSTEADDRQLRHLLNQEKLAETERLYGTIMGRFVIYRGKPFSHQSGIRYLNAASYLKCL